MLLGLGFFRKLPTGIVFPIIVVIPDGEKATIPSKSLKIRHRGKGIPSALKLFHVAGIPINVVAQQNENVGFARSDAFPNRLRAGLLETGTEGNRFDGLGRFARRKEDSRYQSKVIAQKTTHGSKI